ncbi:glycosyltransferase family 90 protein, partial [Saccharata proteae CBS 121410]
DSDKHRAFLVCTIYLTLSLKTSFVFDRPVHSSIAIFTQCGVALILLETLGPLFSRQPSKPEYDPIPLEDLHDGRGSPVTLPAPVDGHVRTRASKIILWISCIILVVLLCTRVEILRRVVENVECSKDTSGAVIPAILAFWEWISHMRHRRRVASDQVDDTIYTITLRFLTSSRLRYPVTVALLSYCCISASSQSSLPRSNFICPENSDIRSSIPRMQNLGIGVDACIALVVYHILDNVPGKLRGSGKGSAMVGLACIVSAMFWLVFGVFFERANPEHREWIRAAPPHYVSNLVKISLAMTLATLAGVRSIQHIGLVTVSVLGLFASTSTTIITYGWEQSHPFPPYSGGMVLLSLLCMILAMTAYFLPGATTDDTDRPSTRLAFKIHWTFLPSLFLIWFLRFWLTIARTSEVSYHPADLLIYKAPGHHMAWLQEAQASMYLPEAVENYRIRYKRDPPPKFNNWYGFAVSHMSYVIDDFDNIHNDLLPFWSLSPQEIRQRTWDAISDPNIGIGGIHIRNGKAEISEHVPGSHRWMLDGVVRMVEKFGEWLPDMDLAFNLNDEPRVAVPYDVAESMRKMGEGKTANKSTVLEFSSGRADGWQAVVPEGRPSAHFMERSFHPTFHEFGSIGCPPSSTARTQRLWDVRELCTECALPHSLGQFVANWTLSADICYQPDLADLHGFYTSPAAFKGTHDLMPVFSQSKAFGYNDLLYPSPWNYMDKIVYGPSPEVPDPLFEDKKNSLFWRGVPSEGVSPGTGTWRGMTRQRMVHIINKTPNPQALLLPYPIAKDNKHLRYEYVDIQELRNNISTDVGFVDFPRCANEDCPEEEQEFGKVDSTDFQAHWGHKYLMDSDGAGFSGRFIPFLQSRSLPFKTALFREWYEGRLTPWLHFIPQDLRLHGLWSTLAYFNGFKVKVNGKVVEAKAKQNEAQRIAEEGRKWANQVLRKEDMEIYMFRLLLEWGRLTDDRRDELGYTP